MNTKNSNKNESHKFRLAFADKLNLKDSNKNVGLANLSIYFLFINIKSAYNNNKFKISAPAWNDEFDLPHGSYSISDIQDCFEEIFKKHEIIANNSLVQIYLNEIKNRIVFKIKIGYKIQPLSPETMKLLGNTKNMLIKMKMVKMSQN